MQITRRGILSLRSDPDLELYTGSKLLASLWLAVVAGMAGALGGIVVSGALWDLSLSGRLVAWWWPSSRSSSGKRPSACRFGGCLSGRLVHFLGMLTGVMAGWGAQLGAAGWAYGIAGGMGFLIGITHGNLQHADIEAMTVGS
jgi:hypothetical protein